MPKTALNVVQKYYPKVNRVLDSKRDVRVRVTARDCKGAKKGKPSECAMARACERDFDGAIISLSKAYLIQGRTATRYSVPSAVAREIVSFDRHHDFAPGEYWLKAPAEQSKLGPRKGPQPERRRSQRYAHDKRRHHTSGIRAL